MRNGGVISRSRTSLHGRSYCYSVPTLLFCAALICGTSLKAAEFASLPAIYEYRAQDMKSLRTRFAKPPREAAPWIYWMWFDNVVSKDEIERELIEIADAGFGGVELRLLSFYGWSGTPPVPKDDAVLRQLGHRRLKYQSDEFLDVLEFTCATAERLGLRFSLNMGMGWPPGGTWITEEHRSKLLSWTTRELEGSAALNEKDLPHDSFVLAWKLAGDGKDVEVGSFRDLSSLIQWREGRGALRWETPPGRWLAAVFRVTPGGLCDKGEGYEADPGSAKAVEFHLNHLFGRLDTKLRRFYGKTLTDIASDSWEYEPGKGRYWSATIPDAFRKHTGYDLRPRLYAVLGYGPEPQRVLADLQRVEQELVRDNFLVTSARILHERGLRHRPQLYGRGLSRDYFEVYALADVPEIEQWEFVPEAPWTARTLGHPIISAESFTFLSRNPEPVHAPHGLWESAPAHLRWHANNFFSLGINRIQFHSFGYSPPGVPLPGWRIYAETHFNRNVPWWPNISSLTTWMARVQWFLQAGEPVADALVYPVRSNPLETPYNTATDQPVSAADAIDAANPRTLSLVRDRFVAGRYQVKNLLLLDKPGAGPEADAIADFEKRGVRVIRAPRGGTNAWSKAVVELRSVHWPEGAQLAFQHRRVRNADLYFVVNRGEPFAGEVSFPHTGGRVELWDADRGAVRAAARYREEAGRTFVSLSLGHFESVLLTFSSDPPLVHLTNAGRGEFEFNARGDLIGNFAESGAKQVQLSTGRKKDIEIALPAAVPIRGPWKLTVNPAHAVSPQPPTNTFALKRLVSWRELPELKQFAGTVTYTTDFELSGAQINGDLRWTLKLGDVYELAHVWLNGHEIGTAWSPPFHLEATDRLKRGRNTLRIEVPNVLKNHLEGGDDYHRPSGLLGPVQLVPKRCVVFHPH